MPSMMTMAISIFTAVGDLAEGRRRSIPLISASISISSVPCSIRAKNYGSCVASKIPEVKCDMCLKEFCALKNCMKNVSLLELGSLLFGGKATYTRVFPDPGEVGFEFWIPAISLQRCGHRWEYNLLYCFFFYHPDSLKSGVPSIANWYAKLQI
ncbi:hypothetical protein Cgig2_000782 [Carnegiea gigantea]|uniref:Uncharacterized protein n=1 Tax=Carnegiea gigantea TaxID=171969 RepID=A0A9Q1KLP1_9CARY|nr:hypothetical protein Cgig2_000782 [Carnegiea gigantea]